jgi:serine/threonine-protein phosphatase 2A regulatory subunit B
VTFSSFSFHSALFVLLQMMANAAGRYLLSRDYMTLRLWDCHMESVPVKVIHVHEQLRPRLCDL